MKNHIEKLKEYCICAGYVLPVFVLYVLLIKGQPFMFIRATDCKIIRQL